VRRGCGGRRSLEWKFRETDAYFNAHSLSDRTLRFIRLATLLFQPVTGSVAVVVQPHPEHVLG
jgi:predicted ATPase